MRTCFLLLAAILAAGCSNKAVYDNLQHNQRLRCLELPPAAYDECMEGTEKSYEEYERELDEYKREREEEQGGS